MKLVNYCIVVVTLLCLKLLKLYRLTINSLASCWFYNCLEAFDRGLHNSHSFLRSFFPFFLENIYSEDLSCFELTISSSILSKSVHMEATTKLFSTV